VIAVAFIITGSLAASSQRDRYSLALLCSFLLFVVSALFVC
jgi:hypothetical protein